MPGRDNQRILVLDDDDGTLAHAGCDEVLLWKSFRAAPAVTSVPRYLEEHGERLRAKYLAFVHDLGGRSIAGRRLIDHFMTTGGFSLWWMNRVAEKSPFKSPRIYDCLRLMALEEMLKTRGAATVTLRSADRELAEAIGELCAALGFAFSTVRLPARRRPWSIRRLYNALPHALQGLISVRHFAARWRFRRLRAGAWLSGANSLCLITYFFNLDRAASEEGRFLPAQWGALPPALAADGRRINWLHHYLPDSGVAPETGLAWLERFNARSAGSARHAFVETFLSMRVGFAVIGQWIWLHLVAFRLRGVAGFFRPRDSAAWFWPLLRDDWRNSLHGTTAVSNAAWVHLFDAALARLPKQQQGFYLYEGQGWETAMLHAWRRHGHGTITGVPHSSMPFWYLNIYDDPRCLERGSECGKPIPDGLCVNGPMARDGLARAGYPQERLLPVEALRYQYLLGVSRARSRRSTDGGAVRLLILGDFTRRQTLKMLRVAQRAAAVVVPPPQITVKLHPSCVLDQAETRELPVTFTGRPLAEIVDEFDVAFCSNSTSASLDALLAGLRVAIFLDDDDVNQSPLRGSPHVRFVIEPAELTEALQDRAPTHRPPLSEFFWLDEDLPRWRNAVTAGRTHA